MKVGDKIKFNHGQFVFNLNGIKKERVVSYEKES